MIAYETTSVGGNKTFPIAHARPKSVIDIDGATWVDRVNHLEGHV